MKKADVVFVTDGAGKAPDEWWSAFKAKHGVTCYGIAIDTGVSAALEELSDEAMSLRDLSAGSTDERKATDSLFGI